MTLFLTQVVRVLGFCYILGMFRAANPQSFDIHLLMILLLCLGVLMQILGVAVSFWDLNDTDDPFAASLITGFAVLPADSVMSPLLQTLLGFTLTGASYEHLAHGMLFHPPLS